MNKLATSAEVQELHRDVRHALEQLAGITALLQGGRAAVEALHTQKHAIDFSAVEWRGQQFQFNKAQRRVVALLWAEHSRGFVVDEETIGRTVRPARSRASGPFRVDHCFRRHPALGSMIVRGKRPRTWTLAEDMR